MVRCAGHMLQKRNVAEISALVYFCPIWVEPCDSHDEDVLQSVHGTRFTVKRESKCGRSKCNAFGVCIGRSGERGGISQAVTCTSSKYSGRYKRVY